MEKRFRALRIIGTVFKILAWIALALGVLGALGALVSGVMGGAAFFGPGSRGMGGLMGGVAGGILGALVILVMGAIYFLSLYAAGEFIYLGLAVEENTRETADLLRDTAARIERSTGESS